MIWYLLFAFFLSLFGTPLIRSLMQQLQIIDRPKSADRKIHKKNTPLGGGVAIFISFFIVVFIAVLLGDVGGDVKHKHLLGLFFGGLVLMIGGLIDDKYTLRARTQFVAPILATLIVIGFGIGPHEVTNPFGGVISLDLWTISFDTLGNWVVLADIVVFFWLMGVMFTTKLLDGLDGLVAGMSAIGALLVFFLSQQEQWYQPEVAALAIIFAGACLGFLYWNWHPAKIFLGEGGSLFTGFMLGTLAIISGGKIATTLLVLAVPILDIVRVLTLRLWRKQSIFVADSEHLHFKLVHSGLTQKQAVFLFYAIALLFGMTTLFLQSREKLMALVLLLVLMLVIGVWFSKQDSRNT